MPTDHELLPATLSFGLLQTAKSRGLDYQAWLNTLRITQSRIEQADATLTYRQTLRLIELAVAHAPDLPLGLDVGTRAALTPMGMLGVAMISSRTVAEAVEFSITHHKAAGSLLDFFVFIDGEIGELRVSERKPEPRVRPFLYEEFLSSVHLLIQAMLGEDWQPIGIDWPYPEPPYRQAYDRIFRCPLHFDAPACRLRFDPELMQRPLRNHSLTTLRLAQDACRELIRSAGLHDDLSQRAATVLKAHLPQRVDAAVVAAALNLSERSLRRRLSEQNRKLKGIQQQVWGEYAQRLLDRDGGTVQKVAEAMGFGDTREFRRAFKRWTGRAPRQLHSAPCRPSRPDRC